MRHRMLSLALAAVAIMAVAGSASAQIVRSDTIIGFAQTQGVPPIAAGTFVPSVRPTDAISAADGTVLGPYVTDLDAWFASVFGFRASKPVTFLLFSDEGQLVNGAQQLIGSPLSDDQRNLVLSTPSFLTQANQSALDVQAGNWAILVNTDVDRATQIAQDLTSGFAAEIGFFPVPFPGPEEGMRLIQWSMARDYATLMELEQAGTAGPLFYRAGLADATASRLVPATPQEAGRPEVVSNFLATTNDLPSLAEVEQNWISLVSAGGQSFDLARGIAFLSVNTVFDRVGAADTLNILRRTAAGEDFESTLQSVTGLSLFDLDVAYQPLIPTP